MTVHTIGGQVGHVTKHPATHFQVGRVRSAWITCQVWQQWMKLNMNFYQHPVWDTESLAHTWHPVERSTHSVTGTDSVSILDDFFWWDASCREHVNSVNLWASHQRENQPSNKAFTRTCRECSLTFPGSFDGFQFLFCLVNSSGLKQIHRNISILFITSHMILEFKEDVVSVYYDYSYAGLIILNLGHV